MKMKIFAAILVSALFCVAQTNNQNSAAADKTLTPSASTTSGTTAECPCCKAMAKSKDAKPCCQHDSAAKDSKEAAGCCKSTGAMSCMKGNKAQSAGAASGTCCGGSDKKDCCAKSDKDSVQTAMACCGGSGGHCGTQHDHGDINK